MTEQNAESTSETSGDASQPGDEEVSQLTPAFWDRLWRVVVLAVLGPLAFLLNAVTGSVWAGAVTLLAALGFAGWCIRPGSPVSVRLATDVLRLSATLWVMVRLDDAGHGQPALIGATVIALAVLVDAPLTRLSTVWVAFISNMPGVAPAPERLTTGVLASRLGLGVLGLGVLVGALGRAPWLWVAVAAALLVWPAMVLVRTLQRLAAGRRIESQVPGAVADFAPQFVVYTSRPDEASYQVTMWLPYLRRTGRRFVIVARTNAAARAIAAETDLPVITRRGVADLDAMLPESLRVAFYVNASSGNGAFVRYSQLTHVYLGHGDSDKPPSFNPTHAMYDVVFAAGEAAIDRYPAHGVNIPREKFQIVGRPQVEGVQQPRPGPPGTVLYAPTWRGHVAETMLYSLPAGERIVAALLARGATVIFRPHPFSYDFPEDQAVIDRIQARLREDAAQTGRPHLYGPAAESERGIIDCINASDAMVSDVSSVVSDYLFSNKPLAIVAVPCPAEQFVREYPVAAAAYVIDSDLRNLDRVLDDLLGPDPRREARRSVATRYLGDFPADRYAQAFVDACLRVIDAPPATATGGVDDTIDVGRSRSSTLIGKARTMFAMYGRDVVLSMAALVVFVLATRGAASTAKVLAFLLLAAILVLNRRVVGGGPALHRALGALVLPRVVLATATTALWPAAHRSLGLLAVTLLVAVTVAELPLRGGWGGPGTGVRNLPGLEEPTEPRLSRGVLGLVDVAQVVLLWVLVATGLTPLIAVLTGLGGLVVALLVLRSTDRRLRRLDDVGNALRSVVAGYAPEFAVYFGSAIGADYQVGMWAPYFDRIGTRYVIVTRTLPMMRAISDMVTAPVIFRPTLRSLEDVVVPSLTAAFYVNNAVRNTHFIERRELTHIWLNHGDSEKPACFNPVHAIYDKIYAAGQAGIDRYARHGVHIPREKFEIVGRPQVERISPARGPIASLAERTVLYAPTWRGPYADSRVYSLPRGAEIVKELLARGARVVFRAHPFNERFPEARSAMTAIGKLLESDRKKTGRDHVWGPRAQEEWSIEDCFNASDAMVADVSAVLSDYLKSGKPFAIVSIGRTPDQLVADAPVARAGYLLKDDLSNLPEIYDDLLGADPLAPLRRKTKIYYLGAFPDETYADGFLEAARRDIG